MIEWSKVTPEEFEKLCAEILELNGFSNIEWYGKSGNDKGRDITATRVEDLLPGIRRERKWIVQCKRYVNKRLTKHDLEGFLIAAKEHSPDTTLLIISSTLTPDVRDWLKVTQKDYRFDIFVWEERDLEREIRLYTNRLTYKPPISPQSESPVLFYAMSHHDRVYMCNEIEDVGFYVANSSAKNEHDITIIKEFINFIRENKITFDDNEAKS